MLKADFRTIAATYCRFFSLMQPESSSFVSENYSVKLYVDWAYINLAESVLYIQIGISRIGRVAIIFYGWNYVIIRKWSRTNLPVRAAVCSSNSHLLARHD